MTRFPHDQFAKDFLESLLSPLGEVKQPEPKEEKLPKLWILTPTLSVDLLESLGAKSEIESWGEGVDLLSPALKTGIIVIHQLPQTPASLATRARRVPRRFSASRHGLDY
jgi:hypothetical protein